MTLRPLSEHGEGYCRACHFIEPLNYDGRIAQHYRGIHSAGSYLCEGSYSNPPSLIPYRSRLAAFRITPRVVVCAWCKTRVTLMSDSRQIWHAAGNPAPSTPLDLPNSKSCKGSYKAVRL